MALGLIRIYQSHLSQPNVVTSFDKEQRITFKLEPSSIPNNSIRSNSNSACYQLSRCDSYFVLTAPSFILQQKTGHDAPPAPIFLLTSSDVQSIILYQTYPTGYEQTTDMPICRIFTVAYLNLQRQNMLMLAPAVN